jgi:hypothetical protein
MAGRNHPMLHSMRGQERDLQNQQPSTPTTLLPKWTIERPLTKRYCLNSTCFQPSISFCPHFIFLSNDLVYMISENCSHATSPTRPQSSTKNNHSAVLLSHLDPQYSGSRNLLRYPGSPPTRLHSRERCIGMPVGVLAVRGHGDK